VSELVSRRVAISNCLIVLAGNLLDEIDDAAPEFGLVPRAGLVALRQTFVRCCQNSLGIAVPLIMQMTADEMIE
jgi:hypothetical protein